MVYARLKLETYELETTTKEEYDKYMKDNAYLFKIEKKATKYHRQGLFTKVQYAKIILGSEVRIRECGYQYQAYKNEKQFEMSLKALEEVKKELAEDEAAKKKNKKANKKKSKK